MEVELSHIRRALAAAEDAWLKAESKRDTVQQALVVAEEARRKAEEKNGRLTDERLSLLMELGATKDEFVTFQEKTFIEKTTMESEFDANSDVIFNYSYSCCALCTTYMGVSP